jgi:DNA-binding NarL/FixJ family response regulator
MSLASKKIGVLVIDDHAAMREGIGAIIGAQRDMFVVGEGNDGAEAIAQFKKLRPAVTLMDLSLPVLSGIEAMGLIRADFPEARLIAITASNGQDCIDRAFQAGAQAFLHKVMLRRELLPAIRAVYGGQQYIPKEIASRLKREK